MDQGGGNKFAYSPQPPAGPAPAMRPPASPEPVSQPQSQLPQQPEPQPQPQPSGSIDSSMMQWQASEFIDHQKSVSWFVPLALVVLLLAFITYLLSKDILSTVVVALAGVAFGTFARQKPRTLTYSLLPTTIKIGDKSYSYDDFRSFSIVQEGALYSVFLEPVKRFMPPLSIYFAQEDGEQIFDVLALHIPHQERQPDAIDRFMKKIRF